MRLGKLVICLATVGLLLLSLLGWKKESEPDDFLSAEITYGDRTETVSCWNWEKDYYLFLPGNENAEQIKLRVRPDQKVFLDGERIEDGTPVSGYQLNRSYSMTSSGKEEGNLIIMQSSQLPVLYLDVASGNMDHIHEVKGNEEPGKMQLYDVAGQKNYIGAVESLKGRGNSTWKEPKKSYSLNLAEEADLLGMGAAQRWVLLSNSLDASNLRNKIVYDFAADFGLAYSPDSRLVDLYLNGEYAGVYLLCERNEIHEERVNIPAQGSFLVSRDLVSRFEEKGVPHITTESQVSLRIYHSELPQEDLRARWQSVENAIAAENGVDPVSGKHWMEMIDLDSWAKKYLIEEVFCNIDGFVLSQFFYLDGSEENGKIYAGPVWDYDLSMRTSGSIEDSALYQFVANLPDEKGYLWGGALYQKEEFRKKFATLYVLEFYPTLEQYLEKTIPELIQGTADASAMNASRWGYGNADECADQIVEYLSFRKEFLKDVWSGDTKYYFLDTYDVNGDRRYYAVREGDAALGLPVFTSTDSNYEYRWRDMVTGELFDIHAPIFADARIQMYYEKIEPKPAEPAPEEMEVQDIPVEAEVEKVPEITEVPAERLALTRVLPILVLLGMMAMIVAVGLAQSFGCRKKWNGESDGR